MGRIGDGGHICHLDSPSLFFLISAYSEESVFVSTLPRFFFRFAQSLSHRCCWEKFPPTALCFEGLSQELIEKQSFR